MFSLDLSHISLKQEAFTEEKTYCRFQNKTEALKDLNTEQNTIDHFLLFTFS
jgi:hypothetical protein